MNRGLLYAIAAYSIWGLLPIYWKLLQQVGPGEILAHRIVWACLCTVALLVARRQWKALGGAFKQPRVLGTFALSALLLTVNWFVYIWAVNTGQVVETSLGYFINPLVSVLLGVLFLGERLRLGQGLAIALAASGVVYLAVLFGSLPWIALLLATSFGLYGLLRKTASLESLVGLTLETLLTAPLALAFLVYLHATVGGAFVEQGPLTALLFVGSGLVTATPLLLFAAAARRITLTSLGITQYIAPTIQLGLGVLVYGEPLTTQRLVGFGLIWLALLVYSLEGVLQARRRPAASIEQPAEVGI